jgi:hypothetical protein
MFQNESLKTHIESSNTIKTQSAIIAEWNMNIANNIFKIGNYRYRPTLSVSEKYKLIPNSFDVNDLGNFYTNATDSDIKIDGGIDPSDNEQPWFLLSQNVKNKMLYSLEDCFKKFRPRSGINKSTYIPGRKIHHSNLNMSNRPRYYMADKNDNFKYWTSYRTENGSVFGIANKQINGQYFIDDACPFVVYSNPVPANRIVVKMQTNVGSIDLGPFSGPGGSFPDPLYGELNKTTPLKWKIQYLKQNDWIDVISFDSNSKRKDGTSIIKSDGYVELAYGLKVPDKYKDVFIRAEEYYSESFLPKESVNGYAYLIKENENDIGIYHIWFNNSWETFIPTYGWYLEEETVTRLTNFVTDLTAPISFLSQNENKTIYREFENIRGIRVIVDTMNKVNSTFDLIELSPRLVADISEKVTGFSVKKSASDLGSSGLPVGQLLASVGSLSIFDYDDAFNENNTESIISKYLSNNIQIKFYDIVVDVDGYDYMVPIKTLYCDAFPKYNPNDRKVNLELRDLYFYFESIIAPQMLVTNVSLSYAVSLLLDSVGFSNYTFKRLSTEKELIIPFFYIGPDKTVASVLNDLAISTQTAMFFDEYNNFIMMSKNYMLPNSSERQSSFTFYGSKDFVQDNEIQNKTINSKLTNIIDIASTDKSVFNDGKINYKSRYIQRSYGTIKQASMVDNDAAAKNWIYKPVLLWEVTGENALRSINGETQSQSSYSLSAIPLNSDLSSVVPFVVGNQLTNNTIDLGEAVYWLGRHSGYFYANGEIIKFDAVQYSIPGAEKIIATQELNGKVSYSTTNIGAIGNVWISSNQEYQNYLGKLTFNGKIYPTGLVRIYAEPKYEEVNGITVMKNGDVARHGRGQFGTPILTHKAGLDEYWTNNSYVRGMDMKSEYLFGLQYIAQTQDEIIDSISETTELSNNPAGVNNIKAKENKRTGIIKNFLSTSFTKETQNNTIKSTQTGSIQSSALVMNGPSFSTTETPINFLSYQYKALTNKYKHFGTRMRIVGKIEATETRGQTPLNSTPYYVLPGSQPNQSLNISGGSGGIAVLLNPETNVGYYFEIISLTEKNVSDYSSAAENLHNVVFYKILSDENGNAIPIKLWGGFTSIVVDDGNFTGQSRIMGEENPTVYDLAIEYKELGSVRQFYLYINNQIVGIVDDNSPTPVYNNMALFVRGGSKCMFENIYALTNNYSQNTIFSLDTPVAAAFGDNEINANESFRKYAMSGIIQSTYLSGISPSQPPSFNMYFEEFGTIMREAAYLKIRYDKAYPALYAQLSPTFNRIKGYTVSGFRAGSYGAEFLIFNSTDTTINLDETSGNYLRIQGITFTQQSDNELTVDNYFAKNSNFSDPQIGKDGLIVSPIRSQQDYDKIKTSRLTYGRKEFSIDPPYIQSEDDANELMSWIIEKIMKPRKNIGMKVFNTPIIQLGDIVNIEYKNEDNVNVIAPSTSNFVVYNIDYQKDIGGPSMTLYLSEV